MSNMSKGKTMKVYGITGSIACGKSTVTHYLIERGYLVVDADLISRNALTIDQECILKVQELFGCVKDGIVDRKALGRIVFHDKNAKKQLEAIIHPYVILKMKEEIEKNEEWIGCSSEIEIENEIVIFKEALYLGYDLADVFFNRR